MKSFLLSCVLALSFSGLFAQSGYSIRVEIENYQQDTLLLGYYLMDKQYVLDTVAVASDKSFTFQGEEPLKGGMYFIYMPPDLGFFQILVTEQEQRFSIRAKDPANPTEGIRFSGSNENTLFYNYLNELGKKRPEAGELQDQIANAADEKEKAQFEEKLDQLNQSVLDYQKTFATKHSATLAGAIVKANVNLDMPEFDETDEEALQVRKWQYTKHHFFDNLNLADPNLLRTPLLFQRVDYYVNKLTVQHPDSIFQSVRSILSDMQPNEETFKMYLIHFLNTYARSKIIGFDAIYVAIVNEYYAKGLAPWTEEEQLSKIIDNAKTLEPLLIGKIAPNIKMQTKDEQTLWLHDVDSPYTILFFWDPNCGHCKKSMPGMIEFYNEYKDKGVEIFAVCTKFYRELDSCWEFIDDKGMGIWLNTVDPYHRSKFKTVYDIKSTPQIYLLDHKKEILSKRLGVEQLADVLDQVMKQDQKELENR
jgi:thiol-disulfide isomerase/thioredoxin